MTLMIKKEMKLSASPLAYIFTLFGLMFFLPGYPVLCGAFFTTLGIYQSFQYAREAEDTLYSALLPVAKADVVRAKYAFCCLIEGMSLIFMAIPMVIRMTVMRDNEVYLSNVLMNGNLFALGMAVLIFALFNMVFVGGFFRTGYVIGRPFIIYIILCFLFIGLCEALHHIPSLSWVNSFGTDSLLLLGCIFIASMVIYCISTLLSLKCSIARFEEIDL